MAKSKLMPLNIKHHPTIPKAELQSSKLAASLWRKLVSELNILDENVIFWTDSTIVLQYLNNPLRQYQRFVANRIAYILGNSKVQNWRKVPGIINPADIASRGALTSKLIDYENWKNGPDVS